jgi:hypothetical protein
MSKVHRHLGVAIFLACAVLVYIVFRPAPLEKPTRPEMPVAADIKPDRSTPREPAAIDDDASSPGADAESATLTAQKSGDQTSGRVPAKSQDKASPASSTAAATDARDRLRPKELFEGWEAPAAALMLTGEMHGYIEPCGCSVNQLGGLSRRADLLRQIDERGWPVTALDVGGLVNNPNRRQGKFKFDMILKCLIDMQYAGVAMGVEELQLGFEFLTFHQPEKLPFLSANIVFFEDPRFEGGPLPSRIFTVGKIKIGVIAVFGPELEELARPGGQAAGGFEFKVFPPTESITKQLAHLDPEKPDLLVLLSHAAYDETKKLAEPFPQFDIIVTAGGPEDPSPRPTFLGERTLLVAPGQKGKHVPVVGFFPKAGKDRLKYELVDLDDKRFKDTPKIVEHMRFYQDDMLQQENLVASEPDIDDPRSVDPLTGLRVENNLYVGAKVCAECHKSAMEVWETTKHAHATETLKTGGPRHQDFWINRTFDPECVACHVTGWDPKKVVRYKSGYTGEGTTPHLLGQQCENCHGPGGRHTELERQWTKDQNTTDAVVAWRKFHRLSKDTAFDLCAKCHDGDNDPNFGTESHPFEEYWEQIAHPGRD